MVFSPRRTQPGFGVSPLNQDVLGSLQGRRGGTNRQDRDRAGLILANLIKEQQLEDERKAALAAEMQSVEMRTEREPDRPGFLERVGNILELPLKHVTKPFIGGVTATAFGLIPGEQKGEEALKRAVFGGKGEIGPLVNIFDPTRARNIRKALEETKLPPGVMGTMELLLDPLIVVPVGKAGTAVKAIVKGTVKGAPAIQAAKRLGSLPDIKELTEVVMHPNRARQMAERLSKLPVVNKVIGVINPSAREQTEIGQNLLAYAHLLETGDNLANVGVARFAGMSMPFTIREGFVSLPVRAGGTRLAEDVTAQARSLVDAYPARLRSKVKEISKAADAEDVSFGHAKGDLRVLAGADLDQQVAHELAHVQYRIEGTAQRFGRFLGDNNISLHPERREEMFAELFEEVVTGRASSIPVAGNLSIRQMLPTGQADMATRFIREAFPDLPLPGLRPQVSIPGGGTAAWGDVFENPSRYTLDDAQKVFIKEMHDTLDEATAMLRERGIPIRELNLEEGAHWVPRIVIGKEGLDSIRSNMGKSLGSKASFQKSRFYQGMEDGVEAGVDYLNDPVAVLSTQLRSAYRLIADDMLIKEIRPMGKTLGERLDKFYPGLRESLVAARLTRNHLDELDKTITRVFQGHRLGPEISIAEKRLPDFGPRLRRAVNVGEGPIPSAPPPTPSPAAVGELSAFESKFDKGFFNPEVARADLQDFQYQKGLVEAMERAKGLAGNTLEDIARFEGVIDEAAKRLEVITGRIALRRQQEPAFKVLQRAVSTGVVRLPETRAQLLQQLQRDVRIAHTEARIRASKLLKETAEQRLRAGRKLAEAFVPQPGLAGRIFPKDVAKEITDSLSAGSAEAFFKQMGDMNAVARLGLTGFDFGAGMIQGIPLLATNIPGWIRAQKVALHSLFDPQALERYKNAHSRTFQEMAGWGVPISQSEFVEAALPGGLLGKGGAIEKIPLIGKMIGGVAQRGAVAFNAFGDVARKEFWDALKPLAERKGSSIAMKELADSVSKLTGVTSLGKLGVRGTQQQIERSTFFATRYYRATMGIMVDAFQGGVRGEVARTSMSKMLAGGVLSYYAVCIGSGQEPKLDPRRSDFLTWEVAGQRVGIGSIWVAGARFLGNVYRQSTQSPGDLVNITDSAVVRLIRGRLSPGVSFGHDVFTGRDFIGRPVDNVPQMTSRLLRTSTPFWAQDFLPDFADGELDDAGRPAVGIPAEILGLRQFPTSIFQQRKERQEALAAPSEWKDLGGLVKKQLETSDSILKYLNAQSRAWGLERGDELDALFGEYFAKQDTFRAKYSDALETAEREVREGGGTGREFRAKVDTAGAILRDDYQDINEDPRFQPVRKEFERIQERKEDIDTRPVEDIAFDEYMAQIVFGGDLHDGYGNYLFDEAEQRKQQMRDFYGGDIIDRVEARMNKAELPVMMRELKQGREAFGDYWKIGRDMARAVGLENEYEEFKRKEGSSDGDELALRFPVFKEINKRVTSIRQQMRSLSPALDAWLFKYDYTSTLRNPINERLGKSLLEQPDFYTLDLPMVI
jgi:hypothetical protein